jgi:hypothetical protein
MADGTKVLFSQFNIQAIVDYPCNSRYYALLNQTAILKRPWDINEEVKKVNEYGEVVLTYPTAPTVNSSLKVRIDPIRQRGELGFRIKTQGGEVFATYRAFVCPGTDIRENDSVILGAREYQVLLVDELFGRSNLHHLEVFMRRVDNL